MNHNPTIPGDYMDNVLVVSTQDSCTATPASEHAVCEQFSLQTGAFNKILLPFQDSALGSEQDRGHLPQS